jgi:hypothetical protein
VIAEGPEDEVESGVAMFNHMVDYIQARGIVNYMVEYVSDEEKRPEGQAAGALLSCLPGSPSWSRRSWQHSFGGIGTPTPLPREGR